MERTSSWKEGGPQQCAASKRSPWQQESKTGADTFNVKGEGDASTESLMALTTTAFSHHICSQQVLLYASSQLARYAQAKS